MKSETQESLDELQGKLDTLIAACAMLMELTGEARGLVSALKIYSETATKLSPSSAYVNGIVEVVAALERAALEESQSNPPK